MKRIEIDLDDELHEKARVAAVCAKLTLNAFVEEAIRSLADVLWKLTVLK